MNQGDTFNIIQHDINDGTCIGDKRKRSLRACDLCKKKKVKCVYKQEESCLNCIAYNEPCVLTKNAKKRGPSKSHSDELEKRIQKMESNIQHRLDRTTQTTTQRNEKDSSPIQQKQGRQQRYPSRRIQDLDSLHSRQWPPGISYDSIYYLGDMTELQILSNKIKLDDNSKWNGHQIKQFGDNIVLVADMLEEKKNRRHSNGRKIPHYEWNSVAPKLHGIHGYMHACTGVDQYTAARLLKIYFLNVHPILPVINKIEFLKQYRDETETYPSGELLNAMFGAAARFVECEYLERDRLKTSPNDAVWDIPMGWSDHFFNQAEDIISRWTVNPTTSKVQAIVLIHNHRGNLDSKSSACWLMGGFALRLAQMLGLHRNCDDWDIPQGEKETRKRLWWSLYVSDRFQSALQGKPLTIQDEDIDVGYPQACATWKEVLDEHDNQDGAIKPRFPSATYRPQDSSGEVEIYQLFIEFVKLSEILGRIIQGLYAPRLQQIWYEHGIDGLVTSLDHELTEWRFSLSKALRQSSFEDIDEDKGYFTPVIASMLLFYFSALILLHRPFIRFDSSGKPVSKSSFSSFQICTSAATRGIRIASNLTIHDFLLCPYSFSLYPVMQCCLIHIYNTRNTDPQITRMAKIDLERGMHLLAQLQDMSSSARKLHILLRNIIDNTNTTIDSPLTEMDWSSFLNQKSHQSPQHSPAKQPPGQGMDRYYASNPVNSSVWSTSSVSSLLDTNKIQNWEMDPSPACKLLNMESKVPSHQLFLSSGTAVVGSSEQMEHQKLSNQHQRAEAFTLKQFGFPATPDNSDNNKAPTLGLPDYMFSSLPSNGNTITTDTSAEQPSLPTQSGDNLFSVDNLFRYDLNNPFLGLPSSMNWDQWNEWFERTMASESTWQHLG